MKRILYINVTYKNASTGRIINDIVSSPEAKDTEYRVLFQEGNNADSIGIQFENKIDNILRRGVHKFFGNVDFVTVHETKRLIEEIKKFNPDLIHLHTIHHQCTNYQMLFDFLKEYKKPVVFTAHDCWVYTGGCYYYTEFNCDKFKLGCNDCKQKRENMECSPEKTAQMLNKKCSFYDSCDFVYISCVSEWIFKEIHKSKIKNKNIYCIRNGIDTNVFKPMKASAEIADLKRKLLNNRKYLILGVASVWSHRKGLEKFTKLAESLGEDYQVVLVGGHLPEKSPCENLTYYGSTLDVNELARICNAADLFVNMSIEESFGLVTAEAACCGTPVIAYDSTANSEVVSLAQGTLIERDNEAQMVKSIKEICKTKPEINNIEEIRQSLSKDRMIEEYWDLYNKILFSGDK